MRLKLGRTFWLECAISVASGVLFVLTLLRRDWIERVFHVDPDQGSGALAWIVVAGLLLIALISALLAGIEGPRVLPRSYRREGVQAR